MMRRLRYRFWSWAHRRAEDLWHWIYYKRLRRLDVHESTKKQS